MGLTPRQVEVAGRAPAELPPRLSSVLQRLAASAAGRYLGSALRQLQPSGSASPAAPSGVGDGSAGLERARLALSQARSQMPGLLGSHGDVPVTPAAQSPVTDEILTSLPAAAASAYSIDAAARLPQLEEVVLQLGEERRRLSAELESLRLIVDELREALVRLDEGMLAQQTVPVTGRRPTSSADPIEHLPTSQPAETPGQRSEATQTTGCEADAALPIYPAGSVGVRLWLRPLAAGTTTATIEAALAAASEIEAARVVVTDDRRFQARISLRRPTSARQLERLLRAAGVEPAPSG